MSTWKGKLLLATITKLKFTLPPICHSRTFQFLKMWHREEMVIWSCQVGGWDKHQSTDMALCGQLTDPSFAARANVASSHLDFTMARTQCHCIFSPSLWKPHSHQACHSWLCKYWRWWCMLHYEILQVCLAEKNLVRFWSFHCIDSLIRYLTEDKQSPPTWITLAIKTRVNIYPKEYTTDWWIMKKSIRHQCLTQ